MLEIVCHIVLPVFDILTVFGCTLLSDFSMACWCLEQQQLIPI